MVKLPPCCYNSLTSTQIEVSGSQRESEPGRLANDGTFTDNASFAMLVGLAGRSHGIE
jgi:hypothetical protein